MKTLKNRRLLLAIAIIFSILFTAIGGGKLLVYLSIAIMFFIIGKSFSDLKRLYEDYRLGLKINALQYSAKQFDALQVAKQQLEQELKNANERINLLRATQINQGGGNYDHFTFDSIGRVRKNPETD